MNYVSCQGKPWRNLLASRIRYIVLLALVAAMLGLHERPVSAAGSQLRIGLAADVTSADPHLSNIAPNNAVARHVYDALVNTDSDTRLVPGLATAWKALDDITWEFTLREGVRFSDGSPFDARDVEFSIKRAASLADKGGHFGGFVRSIVDIQIVAPLTIRFRTATPYAVLPQDLHSIFIVSRSVGAAGTADFDATRAALGTGPFKLLKFARGDRIMLTRNEHYWATRPVWDTVTLRIIPQDGPRLAALLAGDVDAIELVPTSDATRLARDRRFNVQRKVSWRTVFLHLDQYRDHPPGVSDKSGRPLDRNPFRDSRVRAALALAIDRKALVERVMEGMAIPAGNLVAPRVFGHDDGLTVPPYDPAGARKLLAEAGFPNGFRMHVAAPNNRYLNDEQIAQALAQMFARVGIEVSRVETYPAATYFTKARNGEFAVALLGWGSFAGDLALRSLLATQDSSKGWGTWNWGHYSNARLDGLLQKALASVDQARREVTAREAMGVAMRDYAAIVLYHQLASWAMRSELRYEARTDEFTLAQYILPR